MAKGGKPGHEKGKVSGGPASGKDTDDTKDKASEHAHDYTIMRSDGKMACTCGETK